MRGSKILVSSNPKGVFLEGTVVGTPLPGSWGMVQAGTPAVNGRHTWVPYAPTADGDPRLVAIFLEDDLQGLTASQPYVSGTRCLLYCPLGGEELNVLTLGEPGTGSANAFFVGTRLIGAHLSGKFVVTATSSLYAPFVVLEHIDQTPPNTDTLVWAMYQG